MPLKSPSGKYIAYYRPKTDFFVGIVPVEHAETVEKEVLMQVYASEGIRYSKQELNEEDAAHMRKVLEGRLKLSEKLEDIFTKIR